MKFITIQVDEDIAKAYQEADSNERQKIQLLVNTWLRQAMKKRSLDDIINEMQQQANANGLTQEILNEILKDD